jgi:hypothetical protein
VMYVLVKSVRIKKIVIEISVSESGGVVGV